MERQPIPKSRHDFKTLKMEIKNLLYTDFISLIREENRPPGGKKTIREFLINSFINQRAKVLEVGCTNGFTSLEVARLLNCQVYGIDINQNSLENAKRRVNGEKVRFIQGNAYNIPFKDNYFDLVICSNATSFMKEKDKAIKEYFRVTKPWGFVAACPMYYLEEPPKEIATKVSKILESPINIRTKEEWISLFKKTDFEIYLIKDYIFDHQRPEMIENLVKETLNKPHIINMPKHTKKEIASRWKNTLSVFNDNLSYVGYSIILLRKRKEPEETELFTSKTA